METEEEAREATDGQEVRTEAVDPGTDHLQTHLDGKFSSNKETKDEAKIMDSTEGMLKIPEDQNLAEAPSEVEIPPELNLNGTTSSLNGHMVKEEKNSNDQPHENDKEDKEKVEVSPDGTSTDQSNKSNDEEVIDSLGHGESTTEDTSLPKYENEEHKEHGQQDLEGDVMDDKMVHKDTLKTDNAIEPTVDPQQDQNLESAEATEDTQPASMSNILDDEVVAEAPVGVRTLEPNVDDSDALPDAIDGNAETVEPAKADDVAHLDHKESSPEDNDNAGHTDEVAEVDDQHSKQTDAVDADVVQEETSKSKETEDPNVDDSNALPDTIDENTETVEPARADDVAHLDHKESSPEDKDSAEHRDEVAEVDDQHSKQTDAVDADVVQEETSKTKETEDPHVDDSDALPDTTDGNTEIVEPARADDVAHLDHKESSPEDKDSAEHTNEVAEEDDQHSKQTDAVDADVVQEDTSKTKETEDPNVDDSDALPDTIDGNTETVEPAKADDVAHLDHKESSPEDKDSAEHTDEVAEVDDQHNKQTDAVHADMVQEETSKTKETEDPNVDDPDALPDTIDGNTETIEPAKADDVAHLDHKESSPEDKDSAEHTDEVAEVDDQHSKKTDAVDADVVQEETSKTKETEDTNVDDSDALPDTIDGNTETVEPARADDVAHLDHKESSPEDKDSAEHTDEVAEVDDQHSKQTDAVDEDVVQEETSKTKESEDPNVDDSDALPDTIDGNTETVEPARADDVAHLDHKESSPEDKDSAKHTDEVAEVDDQHSKQTDAVDADVVQEETSKTKESEDPNVDDSDALLDTIDGNIETVEAARADDASHLDHKESSTEDKDSAEHRDEVAEVDDQHSKQTDAVDADVVQEETSKTKETEDPNVGDSDALPDTIDGNTETVEPAKADDVVHLDHKESSPEDKDSAKHTDEVAEVDDKHSKQTDAVDADVVQEETSKIKETEDPNVDDSDALPDTIDGNTETVEPDKADDVAHLDHKESSPDDKDSAEHTDEVAEVDDQHSKQTDAVDADVVQEETSKTKETEDPNVDDSDALPDTIDGNTETVEPARADDVAHLDHKESSTEDKDSAEYTDEVAEVDDQHSKQTDAVDADVVQEEIPKSMKTEVQEEMPKTEQADDSTIDAHVLDQELPEETNDPVYEKTEETFHQSSVAASKETCPEHVAMMEPAVNIQEVQNQGSVEEMIDAEALDTEKTMQQSSAAFEEEIPEDNVATTAPSSDIQHVHNVESEEIKALDDAKAEESSNGSNVDFAEDAVQDKVLPSEPTLDIQPVQGSEQEETENTGSVEMDEASNQTHGAVQHNLAQEDGIPASEPHVTELAEEVKDIEATETQEITHQCHAVTSKELSTEDNSTASEPHNDDIQQALEQDSVEVKDTEAAEAQGICHERATSTSEEDTVEHNATEGPTCDTQEVKSVESPEEIKEDIADNIVEASNATTVDEADQENNVLISEAIAEQQTRGLEPEEIKNTEPVEIEASDQRHAALFSDLAQEDNTTVSEMQKTEPTVETKENEATKNGAIPQESNASIFEERTPEDNITASETTSDTQEGNNVGSLEAIEGNKDAKTEEISDHSNESFAVEAAQGNNTLESEANADIQPVQELESEGMMNTKLVAVSETSHQMDDAVFQKPTQEDKTTASELHVMESEGEVSNIEATEAQATPHQTNVEGQATEENTTASEPQIPEPESVEEMKDTDPIEPQGISQESIIQQLQEQESVQFKEIEAAEPQGISPSHIVSTSEESTKDDNATTTEPSSDTQAENLESAEVIKDTKDVKSNVDLTEEATPEEHVLATETTIDVPPVQETELEETKNVEPVETQDNITASDLPAEEVKDTEAMETEAIPRESTVASIGELTEDVKSNVVLPDEAAPKEHVLATEATVDTPQVQEPELEEVKNTEPAEVKDIITASDLPAEEMKDTETIETEAIPHESTVASIKELTEDGILTASPPHGDIQQVLEQESVEDMKCTDTTEYQGEPQQSIVSTSDEHTPTEEKTTVTEPTRNIQVQNVVAQEIKDSEDVKTEEFSDRSIFSTPEVVAQESAVLRSEPTSDAQQVQEQDSTEETRGIEAVETEDRQQHGVSTLEKLVPENNVTESEPKVDDQQVQEEKSVVEVKDIESMETEEISDQSNITTSENAAQESSELRSDPDFYVQPAQLLELDEGSKGSQLVKAEQTGESNFAILEEPTAEDNATNEVGPPADIKQEHELESVEEIKHIAATEAEEAFHTSQVAALEEPPSESNIATTEPTYDIQQVNDLEATKEMKATEAINDEEISCQQTEIAVFEDQSSTENGTAPEKLPVESNKENFGNEIDNVMLVHEKIKDEIQESTELKDEASNLGEKTVFTTQKGENITEVDAVQISGEDTIETSHNIDEIKEKPKAVTEHDSSQMSSDQREENVTHVQDRDIKGELLTESGTEEILQASFENDPQAAQDVAENDDTIKSGEQTNDQDNEQHHDLVLQMQVCERSMDALSIGQQDEDVQKVNLDQQQKEGEEIEAQMEQIQTDEQKHDDKRADFTTDPLVEPQSIEVVTNRTEDTDVFEGERTETVVTEMLKNEHTLHVPQESIPRITDMKVENITERKEGTEGENEPNNAGPLDADAENYTEDEQENTGKDAVAAKASTDEQYETTDEIRNVEVEAGLSVEKDLQEISDPAPSNDEIQENVSGENLATKEHNGVEAEAMQQKVDSPNAETHNDDILSTSNPLPEHESGTASDINQNRQYQEAINADDVLQLKPEENAFDKIAETDSNEKMETSYTAATETVTFDEDICDKASGADGALSDESLKTFEDTRRNLDVSSVVTASKGESINKEMEDHKLALPAQPTLDKNTTEQASSLEETERELLLPEKPLPAEPEEQEENQMAKEQDEEDMHEPEIGDTQKEAEESDLPVSNFLMNLILGKESNDPNRNSESEAEKKQEETMKDDSCLITSQQEESSVSFPAENKVDDKLIFEQEKQNVEGSEETHETVKEQSHDFKLDTERSLETDEELNWNTHDSDAPVYQDNAQDEISSELVPGEATGLATETETRDFELDEKAVDTICQEDVEATAQIEEGSLKSNLDDSTSPKASQEDTLEEGRTELLHESLPEDRSSGAVAERTLSMTEPDMGDAEKLPNDTYGLQSPLCTEQEESIDFSNVEAKSTIEVQLESEEVDKKEENQHSATGGSTEEQIENLHDNSQKGTGSEAKSDEQAREITEPVSSTDKNLAHEKEISAGSTCMDEKESYNFSNNEKALEIQSDGPNLHINQDKRDESADSQIVIEKNYLLEKPAESNLQEQQETDTARKSPKETDEGYQKIFVIKETVIKEENVHETVKGHVQTENIKPNEEQEPDSHVQERALDVVSPKEGNEVEESFVEITKQGFSTDKEQSPKADESNMAEEKTYGEKTKDEEEAKNFTDEATMKIEERGAGQKASHKKHNILSSVGSKVKHQIAKVKKAIIGKPGHTKSESPKS